MEATRTVEPSETIIPTDYIRLYSPLRLHKAKLKYWETNGIEDLGENFWGVGRTQEIKNRVLHL